MTSIVIAQIMGIPFSAFLAASILFVLFFAGVCLAGRKHFTHGIAVNIAEGTHGGALTKLSDAAIAIRHALVKQGSDVDHIAVTAAVTDIPLGVCYDEPAAAEEVVGVKLLGVHPGTIKMVANAAITAGALVSVGAAGGKVNTLPGTTGTYYIVGRALNAAGADGDIIEVQHCFPIQRVVP